MKSSLQVCMLLCGTLWMSFGLIICTSFLSNPKKNVVYFGGVISEISASGSNYNSLPA